MSYKREISSGVRVLHGFSRARLRRNPRFYRVFALLGQALTSV